MNPEYEEKVKANQHWIALLTLVIVFIILAFVMGVLGKVASQKFAPMLAERTDQGFQNQEPPVFYEYPSQLLEEYQSQGDNYKEQQFANVPKPVHAPSNVYEAAAKAFTPSRQGFAGEVLDLPKPY